MPFPIESLSLSLSLSPAINAYPTPPPALPPSAKDSVLRHRTRITRRGSVVRDHRESAATYSWTEFPRLC